MKRIKFVLVAAMAMLSLSFATAPAHAQSEITFQLKSNYQYKIQVAFYSETRDGHVWPGVGRAYNLDDSEVHQIKLACVPNEKICYGGWVTGDGSTYWGVGNNMTQSCKSCCYVCDDNMTPIINLDE